MVSENLFYGCLHFRLTDTMISGKKYLIRVNGIYLKSTYQRTIHKNNQIVYVFQYHKINPNLSNDYVYELVSKIPDIQQAMENRALPEILKQITGDQCFTPFLI
jgi:hypothetical protein